MKIKLNLIPPDRKEKIVKSRQLKVAFRIEIVLTLILIGFFAVLFGFKYTLNYTFASHADSQKKNEKVTQYDEIKKYDQQFGQIKGQLSKISTVEGDQLYWSNLFVKLSKIIFPGITLDSLSTNNYAVTLRGIANNRDDLVLFKEKLESENCFSNINLPLSNLVDKNNIKFQISFNVEKKCLKNK